MRYGIQDSKTKLWLCGIKPRYKYYEHPYWGKKSSATLANACETCQKWIVASQHRADMSNATVVEVTDIALDLQTSLFG